MQINLIPDASVSSAPAGFTAAVQAAADVYEQDFAGNYTVNISYGWGTYDGQADESLTNPNSGDFSLGGSFGDDESYTTVRSWLIANATLRDQIAAVSSLPDSSAAFPGGANSFYVSDAQEKAFGALAGNSGSLDGSIGFNVGDASESYYWETGALVEIGHALGWGTDYYTAAPTIADLFRYASPGDYQWTGGRPAYFSIDGGATDLANFSTSFDYTLFTNVASNDPFNVAGDSTPAVALTSLDIEVLNAIGFGGAPPAVPPQLTITNATTLTDQTAQTISGTINSADAGLTVSIYQGSTLLGTATPDAQGDWSASVALLSTPGTQAITAQATDGAGAVGVSNAVTFGLDAIDLAGLAYKSSYEIVFDAAVGGGAVKIEDTASGDEIVASLGFVGSYNGEVFALASDGAAGTTVALAAAPYAAPAPGDVFVSNVGGQPYSAYEQVYVNGVYTGIDYFYTSVAGQPYSAYEYDYSAGGDLIGKKFYYTGVTGQAYTGEEVDYDGGGHVSRIAFTGVTGAPYSSYEYDYVGGVYAGSKFTVTSVPAGATYSSYEVDYNSANAFTGDKFFFTGASGQASAEEEADFDAGGHLSRILLTGITGEPYSSLELDYSAGAYEGYKAYYLIAGQSFTNEEVDASASGQLEKVVYSGMASTPYSSVEQDYSGGAVNDTIYSFTNVSGASAYAYQVMDNASGVAERETFDNIDASHTIIGLADNQTLTSIGNDTMTGGGSGATFVVDAVYGHDTITDFSNYENGANHDTISLPTSEFANFGALTAAASFSGGNAAIAAADGDTLTLIGVTSLAGLAGDFTFHT